MSVVRLFFAFLMIGAVSFGGGYGMIPLIRETVLDNGWLTVSAFVSLIAVSESTPGPLAVNMATYIGSKVGGFAGALAATLGAAATDVVVSFGAGNIDACCDAVADVLRKKA